MCTQSKSICIIIFQLIHSFEIQIIKDSDKARREVILHRRACEGCEYIVQVLDIYVRQNIFSSKNCNDLFLYRKICTRQIDVYLLLWNGKLK